MSAVTRSAPSLRAPRDAHAPVPMRTLVEVELRKMVDTRAGRWLLIGVAAIEVLVMAVLLVKGDPDARSFSNMAAVAQLPLSVLLPVLGILAATSEWTQRTVLTTFSIVPSRGRVVTSKVLSSITLAVAAAVFALVLSAFAALIAPLFGTTEADWGVSIGTVGQFALYQVLSMMLGVALGTLLLNSALAIVLYFVLPTIWGALTSAITGLHDAQTWLDTSTTWMRLIDTDVTHLTGKNWAEIVATAAFWIALPLSIGLARVMRREVD